jgi:ribulose 1,5-bisphosphate synthetase/thiazole synthase
MNKTKDFMHNFFTEIVKALVLIWSAGVLTASYMGMLQKMDPTFVASLLSGTLASYGISRMDKKNDEPPKTP